MRDPSSNSAPAALVAAGVALAGLALGGCLVPETTEFHILSDSTRTVRAVFTLRHIESDASSPAGRREDFAELVKDATGDDALLEAARNHLYMRNRRLYLQGGVLCASYEYLCRDARAIDTSSFHYDYAPVPRASGWAPPVAAAGDSSAVPTDSTTSPDSMIVALRCEVGSGDSLVATNAAVEQDPNGGTVLVWPDSTRDKWAKLRAEHFDCRPAFAGFYREWVRSQGRPGAPGRKPGHAGTRP